MDSKLNQQLALTIKGKKVFHQVKSVSFDGDPELARDLMILGGYNSSRKFLYDMHMAPLRRES